MPPRAYFVAKAGPEFHDRGHGLPMAQSSAGAGNDEAGLRRLQSRSLFGVKSTLTRLETRVGLADHEHFAATAHDLAIAVTGFGRLERVDDFHGGSGFGSYAESPRV
jgi:hypothetical protein